MKQPKFKETRIARIIDCIPGPLVHIWPFSWLYDHYVKEPWIKYIESQPPVNDEIIKRISEGVRKKRESEKQISNN